MSAGQGVGDGDGALAQAQKGVVVFRVADADDLVRRQFHFLQGRGQPGRLVDAARAAP